MDLMELRSGKALVKKDQKEESDNDFKEDVRSLLEECYAVGGIDEEELLPQPRLTM